MRQWLLVGMLVLGPLLWARAWYEVRVQARLRVEGIRTLGTVVRHDRLYSDGSYSYFAVVAFTDAGGVRRECRSTYSGRRSWPIGHEVPVCYLPGAAGKATIDTPAQRRGGAAVLIVVGAVFTAVPPALLLAR
jgi:hypothetical protein